VSPNDPATFLIDHQNEEWDRNARFILNVETTDAIKNSEDICMIVAVYNKKCPLHDRPSNVRNAEKWATALKSLTMTIRADKFCFVDNFYVSVVVLPDDMPCEVSFVYGDICYKDQGRSLLSKRSKEIVVKIEKIMPYDEYWIPIFIPILGMIFLIIVSALVIRFKSYGEPVSVLPTEEQHEASNMNGHDDATDCILKTDQAAHNFCVSCEKALGISGEQAVEGEQAEDEQSGRKRNKRAHQGMIRLKDRPTFADSTVLIDDKWFRRNRSRVYIYLVPLISIFYFVPAIQFVFQAKENEEMTGSMDLCYHNFKCQRPWWIFSDFNHVISNISYLLFGFSFILLAKLKIRQLPEDKHPRNDHESETGLLQQMSIFYAMGFCLMAQAFFSVCYHVCPTNMSLQFDTTMMYVICVLCYVKLYQFRHPDSTANAYSIFGFLGKIFMKYLTLASSQFLFYFIGIVVLIEAVALYSASWWVYGIFLIMYVCMTIFVAFDCYYLGIGRTDYIVARELAKDIIAKWRPVRATPQDEIDAGRLRKLGLKLPLGWIKFPRRLLFVVIFCLINFGHAAYIIWEKLQGPNKNVTHVVLRILVLNLILYLMYYLARKKCCYTTESQFLQRQKVTICKCEISLLSAGTFFTVLTLLLGLVAIICYANRSANRNLSPAQSRNLNEECSFLGFYDYHDMWHFLGAAGIFFAFLSLMTLDDDILYVPRDKIDIF